MSTEPSCTVLYDGECPACTRYIAASGLAERSDVKLLDARHEPELVKKLSDAGVSIDDTMVVSVNGKDHYRADATRTIAEMARPGTAGARFVLWFVGQAPWSQPLYPVLSFLRRVLLRSLGRSLIQTVTSKAATSAGSSSPPVR
jgi:predicted DCC family thiol-disulfide oxidoreductase YuxK